MRRIAALAALSMILLPALAGTTRANQPPLAPTFIEPTEGATVSPSDPHFNLMPFSDPDSGDVPSSSDFEVWDDSLDVRVWADLDETGSVSHVHIRDGEFEGPLAGESRFAPDRDYRTRARYTDSSGAPNAVGPWSEWIHVHTAPLASQFPLKVDNILQNGNLYWSNEAGTPFNLPDGPENATVDLTTETGLLMRFAGSTGSSYDVTDFPDLPLEKPVKVIWRSGSQALVEPASRLRFDDQNAAPHTIYFPPLTLDPGDSLLLWVNEFGATYYGSFTDVAPRFSDLAREVPVPWFPAKAGVTVERVVTGLFLPVNLAFLPDPGPDSLDAYFYVTELYGKLKCVTRNYTVITMLSDILNYEPTGQFAGSGEMGLTGVAYYAPERALYISYVYDNNGTKFGRVERLELSADRKSVVDRYTALEGIPVGYSHQVQMITAGPDFRIYVNTGDGLLSQYAQSPNDMRGKVLRMRPLGSRPLNNPFPNSYAWVVGLRNPTGAAFRPGTNDLFICDNGPDANDRIVKIARGSNYGWCCTTSRGAVKVFNPTVAPVALCFPPPGCLPPQYDGRLFMTMSGPTFAPGPATDRGKQIWSFALDDTGAVTQSELFLRYVGNGYATACGLGAGPDGLYFTDLYGDGGFNESGVTNASIYRVSPGSATGVPEPLPPVAELRLTVMPNPTRGVVHIHFEMPRPGRATIEIFDVQGRLRKNLGTEEYPEGESHTHWNGRDDSGRAVPSGIYFVRVTAGKNSRTARVVVSR